MRRRKIRKRFKIRSILYISTIAALNLIGFGYAMWEDNLNVNFSLATGNASVNFVDGSTVSGYGKIDTYLLDDKKTLFIEGEYYPSSNIDISISVEDCGTVPVVLDKVISSDTDISTLQELPDKDFIVNIQSNRESILLYTYEPQELDNAIQTAPAVSFDDSEKYQEYQNSIYIGDILACEVDIRSLENSIRETQERIFMLEELVNEAESFEEQHSFKYIIDYIQMH